MTWANEREIRVRVLTWRRSPHETTTVKVRTVDAAAILDWARRRTDGSIWAKLDFPKALEMWVAASSKLTNAPTAGRSD
jgi:hypothetical protein